MGKHNLQKILLDILIESKKNRLSFLTNKQISNQVRIVNPELEDVDDKVKYALYLLKNKINRWNEPQVIRTKEGWTIDEKSFNIWKEKITP
jgi:hypothetical protein